METLDHHMVIVVVACDGAFVDYLRYFSGKFYFTVELLLHFSSFLDLQKPRLLAAVVLLLGVDLPDACAFQKKLVVALALYQAFR